MKKIYTSIVVLFLYVNLDAQQWSFAEHLDGAYQSSMVEDASGNIYLALGISSAPDSSLVEKIDSTGNVLWSRKVPAAIIDIKTGSNRLIIGGSFGGSMIFGSTTLTATGTNEAFLAAYDLSGNPQWARQSTGPSNASVTSIQLNASNEIFASIVCDSVKNFSGTGLTRGVGIADLTLSGIITNFFRVGGSIFSAKIRIDNLDNIYLLASSNDSTVLIDTTSVTISDAYYGAYFFAKFHKNGTVYWAKDMGSTYKHPINTFGVGASGNIYIPETHTYLQGDLLKMNANGAVLWSQPIGSSNYAEVYDLKINANEDLYMTGLLWGSSSFGTCNTNIAQYYLYVTKLDSSGSCGWILTGQSTNSSDEAAGRQLSIQTSQVTVLGWDMNGSTVSLPPLSVQGNNFLAKILVTSSDVAELRAAGQGLNVYPNPGNGKFELSLAEDLQEIEIYDVWGNMVKRFYVNGKKITLNMQQMDNGMYYLRAQGSKYSEVVKIILEK